MELLKRVLQAVLFNTLYGLITLVLSSAEAVLLNTLYGLITLVLSRAEDRMCCLYIL